MQRDSRLGSALASAGIRVAACIVISACREAIIFARRCNRPSSVIAVGSQPTSARTGPGPYHLPEKLNFAEAGPLLCGGVTVFAPLAMYAKPTDRVGIIGIGGLGHMAVKLAAAYGCNVTAFTSSESKFDEAKGFGANHTLSTKDSAAIKKLGGSFDLLISTVNVKLDWDAIIGTLAPNGRLHVVGAVLEPIPVAVFSLMLQQRSVSSSPTGSPVAIATMLDFASRHNIAPQNEHFPMSNINEAFAPARIWESALSHRAGRGFFILTSECSNDKTFSR